MRHLVVGLALAMSVVAVLATTGCASASPQTETQVDQFSSHILKLQELPGVGQVDLNANELTSSASLSVSLEEDVAPEDLAGIGAAVTAFSTDAETRGYVPTEPIVRVEDSTFSYFDGLTAGQVSEQLGYWLGLHREGVDSVRMRTYSTMMNVPAHGVRGAEAELEQPPRYVLVDLPDEINEAQLRSMIDGLSSLEDPGAPGGQWDFLNLAPRTKGEYASPNFPSTTELSYAVTAGNHFATVAGLANVEVVRDRGHDTPLQIRIAVFDDVMDGVGTDGAEEMFQSTEAWSHLMDLVSLLESAGSLDYGVEVLANPLTDGGNFQLEFSVHGCEFTADSTWPKLAEALTVSWEEHAAEERFESDPACLRPEADKDEHGESYGAENPNEDSEPESGENELP